MLSRDEFLDLRALASRQTKAAIRKGIVPPFKKSMKCVDCGEPAIGYDHRNYYKPHEVEPVCKSCNGLRGSAYPHYEGEKEDRAGFKNDGIEDGVGFSGALCCGLDEQTIDDHLDYCHQCAGIDPDIITGNEELAKFGIQKNNPGMYHRMVYLDSSQRFMVVYEKIWDKTAGKWVKKQTEASEMK